MSILAHILCCLNGQIFVPQKLKVPSIRVLHISDTPSTTYKSLIKLVSSITPDVLIHTGDIADDVKLELNPERTQVYVKKACFFLQSLYPYVKENVVLVPGNHDRLDMLALNPKALVCGEGTPINIHGVSIGLAHRFQNLPHGCDFYMYGHDKTEPDTCRYLNGICRINIIDVTSMEVTRLPYPIGTDDQRLRRSKIGI